ncbi:MAG: sulfur oxidation c-type cytochrome SoxA [Burkholderiaceae bacterium]
MRTRLATAALLAWIPIHAHAQASVDEYRALLADKDANPAYLFIARGQELFKRKAGPKNASLERCDFGLGPGVLKGAYAQLPRYFADTGRVQDLESRLVTCMVELQGRDPAEIKRQPFSDHRRNENPTELEMLAVFVAAQSAGMKFAMPFAHPKEQEALRVGEALFYRRWGLMDFSCSTCHNESGKRIRLQSLMNKNDVKDVQSVMATWPTYRVSHGTVRTMQHRMWDCHWQMRLPDIDYGSPASVALIAYLTRRAEGGVIDVPGIKR